MEKTGASSKTTTRNILRRLLGSGSSTKFPAIYHAQCPNLNPIEHIWGELDRRMQYPVSENAKGILKTEIQRARSEMTTDTRKKNLALSMPNRMQSVIGSKGGHTGYQKVVSRGINFII